ncbi:hypothetical protein A4X13_0g8851 [Tilletia indica]|uniref:Uncharacterized protein n=1 Tax=Tilletia indica TaxID=43049 RepID=A0A8T8SD48_9BASI|nr:hypothetical protein A4X13_0g8851 [Tilletia indica]
MLRVRPEADQEGANTQRQVEVRPAPTPKVNLKSPTSSSFMRYATSSTLAAPLWDRREILLQVILFHGSQWILKGRRRCPVRTGPGEDEVHEVVRPVPLHGSVRDPCGQHEHEVLPAACACSAIRCAECARRTYAACTRPAYNRCYCGPPRHGGGDVNIDERAVPVTGIILRTSGRRG